MSGLLTAAKYMTTILKTPKNTKRILKTAKIIDMIQACFTQALPFKEPAIAHKNVINTT